MNQSFVQIVCWDRMILYFCSFSFFENSLVKPWEVDTNRFSDKSLKNEIVKAKHVKLIQENLEKLYLKVITDACVKIAVLEICPEKNTRESILQTFKNICTVAVHC